MNRAKQTTPGVEARLGGGRWSASRLVGLDQVDTMVVADSVNFDLDLIPDLVAKQ